MWLAIGLASLIVAAGIAYVSFRMGNVLARTDVALGKVERQLDALQPTVIETATHVGNLAANVDRMVSRVERVTGAAEKAAGVVAKTADAAQTKLAPAVMSMVGIVAGVSEGARSFFRSRDRNGPPSQ